MTDQQHQQSMAGVGSVSQYQSVPVGQASQQGQMNRDSIMSAPTDLSPHVMSIMRNPGASMFQPQVLMNNPGAYFVVPDMFAAQMHASCQVNGAQQVQAGHYATSLSNLIGNQVVSNGFTGNHQVQQQVAHPGPTYMQQPQQQMQANLHVLQAAPQQQQQQLPKLAPTIMSAPQNMAPIAPQSANLGAIPVLPPFSSSALQVVSSQSGSKTGSNKDGDKAPREKGELTNAQKAKQNRDRNREHARSTRLRKKAYVMKLKELVEGLHSERTEESRKRRVAVQHLAEVQGVRRAVVRSFLRFHSSYESDSRKWSTLVEDEFWFKQPVTPYRSFRRVEIEQDCRISRGIEAMISDAASMSVMTECIGSRSTRWMQIKREEVRHRDPLRLGSSNMPQSITGQGSRLNHAISSLSSSSGSSNNSGGEEDRCATRKHQSQHLSTSGLMQQGQVGVDGVPSANNVSSSSGSGSGSDSGKNINPSNEYHDYHAQPLPDPMLGDSEESGAADDSAGDSNNSMNGNANGANGGKVSSDSSSGDEDKSTEQGASKRRKSEEAQINSNNKHTILEQVPINGVEATVAFTAGAAAARTIGSGLPLNIAKSGGISHTVRAVAAPPKQSGNVRLSTAPAIVLPPFMGIGKRLTVANPCVTAIVPPPPLVSHTSDVPCAASIPKHTPKVAMMAPTAVSLSTGRYSLSASDGGVSNAFGSASVCGTATNIVHDADSSSSHSLKQSPQIRAYYHVNEDDMILTEDVLMCPFIFRSQDAVLCGALAECVMPGMLRARFSSRNKLMSLEMVYDAMGYMQQLERASGSEGNAQIIPGSLEMALSPNTNESRVITLAKSPFLIVSVNEAWTRTTKYTQMEVEGKEFNILHGEQTNHDAGMRKGKPFHKFDEVAKGRCACSTNIHYDKEGKEFIDFVCSYPLTNAHDDITHILHISKELPAPTSPTTGFQEFRSEGGQ